MSLVMDPKCSNDSAARSTLPSIILFGTAGITGALIMVVEILGARIIGPFFGVSLFVWTALISVTLLALAAGYAFGGRIADHMRDPKVLYNLTAAAGAWLVMLPYFKGPVLEATAAAGLRFGAFFSATLLFGPSLFLLGCVYPLLLKLVATDMERLGRTAGKLNAISTAGSFVGSAGTGFYLLGTLGVIATLRLSGALLVLLAVVYYVYTRRWAGTLWLVVLIPLVWSPSTTLEARMPDGTQARIVWARDSFYGAVKVVEYQGMVQSTREMTIDGLIQGGIDQKTGQSIYEYPYLLERLPLAVHPKGKTALVIGLGAGILPARLAERGISTEVVELDPQVLNAAREFFGFPSSIPVTMEDARTFLARSGRSFDFLLIDVFNGDTTPGYLLSLEALQHARQRLSPDGVLALNLVGSIDPKEGMLPSVLTTLRKTFSDVKIYAASTEVAVGNYIVLAGNRALTFSSSPDQANINPLASSAADLLVRPDIAVDSRMAQILSDDFNPLDLRDIRHKEKVRREVLINTPAAILHALPGKTG